MVVGIEVRAVDRRRQDDDEDEDNDNGGDDDDTQSTSVQAEVSGASGRPVQWRLPEETRRRLGAHLWSEVMARQAANGAILND